MKFIVILASLAVQVCIGSVPSWWTDEGQSTELKCSTELMTLYYDPVIWRTPKGHIMKYSDLLLGQYEGFSTANNIESNRLGIIIKNVNADEHQGIWECMIFYPGHPVEIQQWYLFVRTTTIPKIEPKISINEEYVLPMTKASVSCGVDMSIPAPAIRWSTEGKDITKYSRMYYTNLRRNNDKQETFASKSILSDNSILLSFNSSKSLTCRLNHQSLDHPIETTVQLNPTKISTENGYKTNDLTPVILNTKEDTNVNVNYHFNTSFVCRVYQSQINSIQKIFWTLEDLDVTDYSTFQSFQDEGVIESMIQYRFLYKDSGSSLTCKIVTENKEEKTASIKIELDPPENPKIHTNYGNFHRVTHGIESALKCSIVPIPTKVNYVWSLNGEDITQYSTTNIVDLHDGDLYSSESILRYKFDDYLDQNVDIECLVNEPNSIWKINTKINVTVLPLYLPEITNEDNFEATPIKSTKLICKYEFFDIVQIKWIINNEHINEGLINNTFLSQNNRKFNTESTLDYIFNEMSEVKCEVNHVSLSSPLITVEAKVRLVSTIPDIKSKDGNGNYKVELNKETSITCKIRQHFPDVTIHWIYNGNDVTYKSTLETYNIDSEDGIVLQSNTRLNYVFTEYDLVLECIANCSKYQIDDLEDSVVVLGSPNIYSNATYVLLFVLLALYLS